MRSKRTILRDTVRNIVLLLDYLIWLVFDISKFKKIHKDKIKKVLIIHSGALGELLVMTPLLPALKKSLNCEIDFMILKEKKGGLENNPYVSKILTYEREYKKNIAKLRKEKFDLAIVVYPGSLKNAFMCFRAKIPYRIGGFRGLKGFPSLFYTRRTFLLNKKHAVEKNLEIIKLLGIRNPSPKIEFHISKKKKISARKKLKLHKVEEYIVIHPGFGASVESRYPTRSWPIERYAKLINYLIEKHSSKILLTGSKKESLLSEKIIQKVKKNKEVVIANGLFDFGELAYVISHAKLLIGPSTSVTHLAEAFNTPIIDLAGKGHLYEWHPWMKKELYKVFYHNEVCTGCNLMNCERKTIECMNAITTREVINAADELLDKQRSMKVKNENLSG